MRPRPMNPQLANLLPLEAKDLLFTADTEPAAPALHRMHSFDGEGRLEIRTFMMPILLHYYLV